MKAKTSPGPSCARAEKQQGEASGAPDAYPAQIQCLANIYYTIYKARTQAKGLNQTCSVFCVSN